MGHEECITPDCNNTVFSTRLCRKHYERERLATASPCFVPECTRPSHRTGMCDMHYRKDLKSRRPLCTVPHCNKPQYSLQRQLCSVHMSRLRTHRALDNPRAKDWGSREKHAHYQKWAWHKRGGASTMCDEWRADFWAFATAIGVQPEQHKLSRPERTAPISPTNWEWKETFPSKNKAVYARVWRANNPDRVKNTDLKKSYGITLDDYNRMLKEQDYKCAICTLPNDAVCGSGGPRAMCVDHDHATGKVRGILCDACNRGLGKLKDSVDNLQWAINYLTQ